MVSSGHAGAASSSDYCPICGGNEFGEYRGRPRCRCMKCGSKERHRFMALVLRSKLVPKDITLPVYHLAPEPSIGDLLLELFGDNYQPADLDPDLYAWSKVPVEQLDIRRPLDAFQPESVGGFIHSHVLEHIPASIDRVIREMNAALAPGGFHIFQVPINRGWYREDMDPDMSKSERTRLFHQWDHMRQFGDRDFDERILELFVGMERIDLSGALGSDQLKQAAIPPSAMSRHTGHTVYLYRKPSAPVDP